MRRYFLRRAVSQASRRTVSFGKSKTGLQRPTSQFQLGKKASTTGRRKPGSGSALWNCFPKCKWCLVVMAVLLFIVAVAMVVLYFLRLKKLSEKANAMVVIRKFMIHHNKSFEGKDDAEILAGAQQLVGYLSNLTARNEEVKHSIDSILEKMRKGWKPFRGNLYYFAQSMLPFLEAWMTCTKIGTMLTDILSDEEEDFIEKETFKDNYPYWIGLLNADGRWSWLNNKPLTTHYWMDGEPDNWGGLEEYCVEIRKCFTKRKCWNDAPCSERKKWICKLIPDPKWL